MTETGRILVIDDDRAIRTLIAKIVERAGFVVDTASDGREGIEKLRHGDYAVLVVDLMMPHVNGYDIVEFIRERGNQRPAVIVITAMADSAAIRPLDGRIVHSVVRKPFDIDMLGELITATAKTMAADEREPGEIADSGGEVVRFPQS